jgi:hypothetical protein
MQVRHTKRMITITKMMITRTPMMAPISPLFIPASQPKSRIYRVNLSAGHKLDHHRHVTLRRRS